MLKLRLLQRPACPRPELTSLAGHVSTHPTRQPGATDPTELARAVQFITLDHRLGLTSIQEDHSCNRSPPTELVV